MATVEPSTVPQSKTSSLLELSSSTFDFIIVGGGTSGCLIASRLATALPHCSVLLIEAGGDVNQDDLVPGYTKGRFGNPQGNWMYETVPQKELKNRVIPYPRGKGMGGSSGNNFMGWVRGPDVDYDDWAKRVGDDWWKWDNVLGYLKRLEDFRSTVPPGGEIYAKPTTSAHTSGGLFPVGYGPQWQDTIPHFMSACIELGHKINLDNNDGDMLGVGIGQFNVGDGARASSATVFLNPLFRKSLKNLTVATGYMASKLLSKDQRITELEIRPTIPDGSGEPITIHAAKETILTAGCFHSPQLLLLSGIGPAVDLKSLGIPVVKDLPAVGQNLQDHSAFACEFIVKPNLFGHNQLLNDPALLQKATEEYRLTKSGPLAMFGASAAILFPRLEGIISSKEVASLSQEQKDFLTASRRPNTEIWMHSGPYFYTGPCPPDASVLVMEGLCQNTLSRGTVRLRSSNPWDLPVIDPNYMSDPYDMRVAIETLREMLYLADTTAMSSIIESILFAPRARSDESRLASLSGDDDDLLEEFIRETLTQGFHAMSTCVMGKKDDSNKVVGTDFRVDGIDRLRIADMSVCPILTTNHTQVNAYLIGERCAEMLIEEYSGERGSATACL